MIYFFKTRSQISSMNDPDREGWITYTDRASDHLCPIPSHLSDWMTVLKIKIKLGPEIRNMHTQKVIRSWNPGHTGEEEGTTEYLSLLDSSFTFFYLAVFTESSSFLYAKLLDFV